MDSKTKVKVDLEETIKSEESVSKVKLEIKQEKELLIENDFQSEEADGYYQEYGFDGQQEESNLSVQIKEEPFEIFYDHDNNYDEGYEYDKYAEDDHVDNYEEYSSNEEEEEEEENSDDENTIFTAEHEDCSNRTSNSVDSSKLNYLSLKQYITKNFMGRSCHLCTNISINSYEWRKHLEKDHLECITEVEQYFDIDGTKGICKTCKQSIEKGYLQVLHNLEHINVEIIVCKICKYTSNTPSFVKKHILETHHQVIEQFKSTEYQGKLYKCPICNFTYGKLTQLIYHIKDEHPQDFFEKYTYTCHICFKGIFLEKDSYLQHLMDNHDLNSWQMLQYVRLSENKEYFSCLKCFKIIVTSDPYILLKHYLTHNSNCRWNCGTCLKKLTVHRRPYGHLCKKMIFHLKTRSKKGDYSKEAIKLKNWQEFEEHVHHVCSFCNETFSKTKKWQEHLKNVHKINTLKTLKMKVIPGEQKKLCCVVCHTTVVNTPVQLHAHCFQHLPYKPYKCTHCFQSLSTFKIALSHVISRCNSIDAMNQSYKKTQGILASIIIRCPLCSFQQFDDIRDLFKHFEEEHNNFEEYFTRQTDNSMTCNVCTKFFIKYDKNICLRHFNAHLDEKAFKCMLCEKSYTTKKFCYKHLLSLHYVSPLNENKSSLIQEITEISNALLSTSAEEEVSESTNYKVARYNCKSSTLNEFNEYITYACPECNESMPSHKAWNDHIITQHDFFLESNLVIKEDDGNVKCPTCKMKLATNISSQQKHKLTHMPYRSFICKLCYSRFNSLGVLYGHLRRHHFSAGSFKCAICPEILKTAHERTEHLKSKHPIDEWPSSICLICYKVLKHKSSLAGHMEVHDADRVKFTCDFCGAKLLGKRDFKWHVERHKSKGEKRKLENSDSTAEQTTSKSKRTHAIDN